MSALYKVMDAKKLAKNITRNIREQKSKFLKQVKEINDMCDNFLSHIFRGNLLQK